MSPGVGSSVSGGVGIVPPAASRSAVPVVIVHPGAPKQAALRSARAFQPRPLRAGQPRHRLGGFTAGSFCARWVVAPRASPAVRRRGSRTPRFLWSDRAPHVRVGVGLLASCLPLHACTPFSCTPCACTHALVCIKQPLRWGKNRSRVPECENLRLLGTAFHVI